MALAGHPLLQQRRSGIEAAGHDVQSAEYRRYPTLTLENTRLLQRPEVNVTNTADNGMTLRIQQPLWTFGRITSEIDASQGRRQIAELSLLEAEQDLLTRVVQAFNDTLRLQDRVAIATESLAEHQRLYDLIKRRADQEVSSLADMALASARLQQARTELLAFRASAGNARAALEQLLGQRVQGELQPPARADRLYWADFDAALRAAREHSATLRRLDSEVALAQIDVAGRKAAAFPQISARYERFSGSAVAIPFDRMMLTLEYQPGAGLSSLTAIDAAVKRVDVARSVLEAAGRDLTEKVFSQQNEARSLYEQLEPNLEYAKAAGAVSESYLRQYAAGRKGWLEVMNAQRELALARYSVADVKSGTVLSALKLDILTGRLTRASLFGPGGP